MASDNAQRVRRPGPTPEESMPTNLPPKGDTITEHKLHETDTGSPEVQIALLSDRVTHLTEHTAGGVFCRLWVGADGYSTTSRTTTWSAIGGSSPSWGSGASEAPAADDPRAVRDASGTSSPGSTEPMGSRDHRQPDRRRRMAGGRQCPLHAARPHTHVVDGSPGGIRRETGGRQLFVGIENATGE